MHQVFVPIYEPFYWPLLWSYRSKETAVRGSDVMVSHAWLSRASQLIAMPRTANRLMRNANISRPFNRAQVLSANNEEIGKISKQWSDWEGSCSPMRTTSASPSPESGCPHEGAHIRSALFDCEYISISYISLSEIKHMPVLYTRFPSLICVCLNSRTRFTTSSRLYDESHSKGTNAQTL